jgi:hypothetical protein
MSTRPTVKQIDAVVRQAARAIYAHTRYPDRIAEYPSGVNDCQPSATFDGSRQK